MQTSNPWIDHILAMLARGFAVGAAGAAGSGAKPWVILLLSALAATFYEGSTFAAKRYVPEDFVKLPSGKDVIK